MGTTSTRFGLHKPADADPITTHSSEHRTDYDIIDDALGFFPCTSGTRPASPQNGRTIRETDTGKLYVYTGSAWLEIAQKQIPPVALTDASTIAVDASQGNHFRVTLGGNRTLGNPTSAYDGQKFLFEILQDGTGSRTLTLGNKFSLGTDITAVTLTLTAGKRDFIAVVYNSTTDRFYVVGLSKGY